MTKPLSIKEIATHVGATYHEESSNLLIRSVASLEYSKSGDICYARDNANKQHLENCQASAIVLTEKRASLYQGDAIVIKHSNPEMAFAQIIDLFHPIIKKAGIDSTAVIDKSAQIGHGVGIGAHVTVGKNVIIDDGAEIHAGVRIADNCRVGKKTTLYPNVVVYAGVEIGDHCIIHANANIGVDGFGYVREKSWRKIQHIGSVIIENHVEIGAGTCVDRGMIDNTRLKEGAKLDNLIQIGHNVEIGERTAMAACTGVAGSTKIGDDCMIGGASIINGHISIANQTILCGGSSVLRTIEKAGVYGSALTILPHKSWLRLLSLLHKLSSLSTSMIKKLGVTI